MESKDLEHNVFGQDFKKFLEQKILPLTKDLQAGKRNDLRDHIRYKEVNNIETARQVVDDLNKDFNFNLSFDLLWKEFRDGKCELIQLNKKKDKPSKEDTDEYIIYTSFINTGDKIYEQIEGGYYIDSEGKAYEEINIEGVKYRPIQGQELVMNIVLLPKKIEYYGDILTLIEEIKVFIRKYYDCDEQYLLFSSWYVLLTWVYDRLSTINYLRAQGDFGTGKSRFADTVGRICYKPIIGSGAGSMAALKRMVKRWKGTVLTDEGDFREDDEKSMLVKFYNLGFEKNRYIYQCDKNNPDKIEFFDPYCPKIILTRGAFKDQALESRCLTHITKSTKRKDIPILLPDTFYEEQKRLRNKLLKFRFDSYYKINVDKVLEIDLGDIELRLKQAMIGFGSLFANIPEVIGQFKQFLCKYQQELIEERVGSFDGMIINALFNLVERGEIGITSKKILDEMRSINPEFNVSDRTIGKHLKTLGIESKNRKEQGVQGRYIEFSDNLYDLFKKYVSDKERVMALLETKETRETLVTKTCDNIKPKIEYEHVTNVSNVSNVSENN